MVARLWNIYFRQCVDQVSTRGVALGLITSAKNWVTEIRRDIGIWVPLRIFRVRPLEARPKSAT